MVATLTEKLAGVKVESGSAEVNKLQIGFVGDREYGSFKSRKQADAATRMTLPDGRVMKVSSRFWTSFCSMYSVGRSMFDLFSHDGVFQRVSERKTDRVRLSAEFNPDGENNGIYGTVLSMTKPTKPLLPVHDVERIINKYNGDKVTYRNGVVSASFECPFPTPYTIANEQYRPKYMLQMPIDGFGLPITYLQMLRLVCENGMVGMAAAFREQFHLGKDDESVSFMLDKAMSTFSAEEEFHGISNRMENAALSWSSLQETSIAYRALKEAMEDEHMDLESKMEVFQSFDDLCGDPLKFYKLTSRDELSSRRAAAIPTKASVYDLLTFMTEVSTHKLNKQNARDRIARWCGLVLSDEFDLEKSKEQYSDLGAFFINEDVNAN